MHGRTRSRGLESGADDYPTKPFHNEELMARVNALLRRAAGHSTPLLSFAGIDIDTVAQTVRSAGTEVSLTGHEYRILEYLMLHAGKVVSKTELTEHIYDQDFDRDSNVVEVLVGRIRKKVDPDGNRRPIETLRGRGYRLNRDNGGREPLDHPSSADQQSADPGRVPRPGRRGARPCIPQQCRDRGPRAAAGASSTPF